MFGREGKGFQFRCFEFIKKKNVEFYIFFGLRENFREVGKFGFLERGEERRKSKGGHFEE